MTQLQGSTSEEQIESVLREPEIKEFLSGKDEWFLEAFKDFLRDVVASRYSYFASVGKSLLNRKSSPEMWIHDVNQNAQKYVRNPWLHNPWLTEYFIKEVTSCQWEGLTYQHRRGIYPEYHFRNSLEEPYSYLVPPIIGIGFFLLLAGAMLYLTNRDKVAWAAIIGVYMLYHYSLKTWQVFQRAKARRKIYEFVELFGIVGHEICSRAYDVETVSRRLKQFEAKGLYPFSIIFPLLELRKVELARASAVSSEASATHSE